MSHTRAALHVTQGVALEQGQFPFLSESDPLTSLSTLITYQMLMVGGALESAVLQAGPSLIEDSAGLL